MNSMTKAVLSTVLVGGAILFLSTQSPVSPASPTTDRGTVTVTVEARTFTYEFTRGDTALDALEYAHTQDPALDLATQEYPGLGSLVTSMYGLTNGSENKYWQYRVRGVDPGVGADSYFLSDQDTLSWRFAAYDAQEY